MTKTEKQPRPPKPTQPTKWWMEKYELLQTYANREGHSVVPVSHVEKTKSGTPILLGDWVSYQRGLHKRGLLSPDCEKMLAGLPKWDWGPIKRGPKRNEQQAKHIKQLREKGLSLSQIALQVNLSRQRVHQILKKEGK